MDKRSFIQVNPAKEFRDKVVVLYDELIGLKVNENMSFFERDQAIRRFMRKIATHALNNLQDGREEFMQKYLQKYHQKLREQQKLKDERSRQLGTSLPGD